LKPKKPHVSSVNTPRPDDSNGRQARKSPLWLNLLVAAGSLVLFFGISEGVLALAGVKPLSLTEDPYFGFATGQPLFLKKTGPDGKAVYETNPVKLSHFNFQSFPAKKAPGTFRIFTLGGSTTYGHPWRDSTSFTGWLREYLAAADPSRHYEVINAGGISYASYRAARLAEELLDYEPDLFVVYNGHNEFLEERTYRDARGVPGWMRDLSGLLDHTRTYSLLRRALRRNAPAGKGDGKRLSAEVDEVLGHTIGPRSYHRDDALKAQVLEHYEETQTRVGRMAASAGAKVIYVTTPSNEKDCSPFKSEPTPGLDAATRMQVEALTREGEALLGSGARADQAEGARLLGEAARLDPRNADVLYAAGRAALAAGDAAAAKALLRGAIDEDVCPLRALTPMRAIEARAAKAADGGLVDFEAALRDDVRARGGSDLLGEPDFADHVHLTIGNYGLMARGILAEMRRMGLTRANPDAAALARVQARVMARLTPSEEGLGYHNVAKVMNWSGKTADAARAARRGLALDSTSPEAVPSSMFVGAELDRAGRPAEALPHYLRASRIDPYNPDAHRLLGGAYLRMGRPADAEREFTEAWRLGDRDPAVAAAVGQLMLDRRSPAEAIGPLRDAVAGDPTDPRYRALLERAMREAGR
jgi:tetratricopeptide (TPR) repeat protein